MKKFFIFCCILLMPIAVIAQKSLMVLSRLTVQDLDREQRSRYDKLAGLKLHVDNGLYLVSTDVPPDVLEGSSITLSLPFLPCNSITFAASTVEFKDRNNFSWSGGTIQDQDMRACASGDIIIQKNEGLFIGNFTIDDKSYELFDLTGGVQLLIQSHLGLMGKDLCSLSGGGAHPAIPLDETEGPCADIKAKVLILYTNATLQYTTDITGIANLGVAQNNQIWSNSGVNGSVSIAGIVKVDWNNEFSTKQELNKLGDNSTIQALRNAYNAELVVMLGPPYENAIGQVKDIGGPYDSAYAAVDASKATNGWRPFAHELNHLFGARHDNDPYPGTAHGKTFRSGFLHAFNKRYTLMSILPNAGKSVIQHLSNPDIKFAGVATGNWNRNNAGKVTQLIPIVAEFKNDPALGLYAQMAMTNPAPCETNGTATAIPQCGVPPYTYQWYTTQWPIGSTSWEALGTGQSTPTHIPLSSYGSYSRAYKVEVTDAQGNTTTYTKYAQSYCTEQQPYEPVNPYAAGKNGGNDAYREKGNPATGIVSKQQVTIYPNPNAGTFRIELSGFEGKVNITLTDLTGRVVRKLYNGMVNGNCIIPITIDKKLPKSLYLLNVKGKNSNLTQKLILN